MQNSKVLGSIAEKIKNKSNHSRQLIRFTLLNPVRSSKNFLKAQSDVMRFRLKYPLGENEWGLICPRSIGDTYFVCGLAEAVVTAHGGNSVTAFVEPKYEFIPSLFPSIERSVSVTDHDLMKLNFNEFGKGTPFFVFPPKVLRPMIGFKGVTILDCYRSILRLPWGCQLSDPIPVSREEEEAAKILLLNEKLPLGKTVILAPDAKTIQGIPNSFWESLACELKKLDFVPVTNKGSREHFIKGTYPLEIPLSKIRAVAEVAGWVISLRSGLCDLLSASRTHLTILYPSIKLFGGTLFAGYSLRAMGLSTNSDEYEVSEGSYVKVLQKILNSVSG